MHSILYNKICLILLYISRFTDFNNILAMTKFEGIIKAYMIYSKNSNKVQDFMNNMRELITNENFASRFFSLLSLNISIDFNIIKQIDIILEATRYADYNDQYKMEILNNFINSNKSDFKKTNLEVFCTKMVTWHNANISIKWKIFMKAIDIIRKLGQDEDISEFEMNLIECLCQEGNGSSIDAYIYCAKYGLHIPSNHSIEVGINERQLVSSTLMLLLDLNATENRLHNLKQSTVTRKNQAVSNTPIRQPCDLFILVVNLMWQPNTAVNLLKYFDSATYLGTLLQKVASVGDPVPLLKLRILATNLDVAIELRSKAYMVKRLKQVDCH